MNGQNGSNQLLGQEDPGKTNVTHYKVVHYQGLVGHKGGQKPGVSFMGAFKGITEAFLKRPGLFLCRTKEVSWCSLYTHLTVNGGKE